LLRFYDKHFQPLLPAPLYWLLRSFVSLGSQIRIAALLAANLLLPLMQKRGERNAKEGNENKNSEA
jgi:hypothetical protein